MKKNQIIFGSLKYSLYICSVKLKHQQFQQQNYGKDFKEWRVDKP